MINRWERKKYVCRYVYLEQRQSCSSIPAALSTLHPLLCSWSLHFPNLCLNKYYKKNCVPSYHPLSLRLSLLYSSHTHKHVSVAVCMHNACHRTTTTLRCNENVYVHVYMCVPLCTVCDLTFSIQLHFQHLHLILPSQLILPFTNPQHNPLKIIIAFLLFPECWKQNPAG